MSPILPMILFLIGSSFSGCGGTSFSTRHPPVAQTEWNIESAGLSQLPNRKIAITTFGIEYNTRLLFPLAESLARQVSEEAYTVRHRYKEVSLDIPQERMQSLANQSYSQLVEDLQAAGYDIIPYETYKDLPAYPSLIDLGGHESPTSMTFKLGHPECRTDYSVGRNGIEKDPLFPLRNPGLLSNSKKPDLLQAG